MNKRFVLILGGARSGKSDLAEKLARESEGPVVFVATAEARDDEMRQRIEGHRRRRPASWRTVEEPRELAGAVEAAAGGAGVVLVDCITLWTSNLLTGLSPDPDRPDSAAAEDEANRQIGVLHDWYRSNAASLILVSNEVGMGLVPPYALGRAYADLLGRVNQRLAMLATEAYLLIAGIPIELKALAARPWRQDEPYDRA